ncbi:MAG TPA: thioredoxin family protein [Methylibium sp.]|nr:thioredoxin family protein [Methylibium sp.]
MDADDRPAASTQRLAALALMALVAGCSRPGEPAATGQPAAPIAQSVEAAASAIVTPEVAAAVRAATAGATSEGPGIAWRQPAGTADMDALLAESRSAGKPVFLYWGAVWCPPCNQVKATVFKQAEFIEKSRGFIPVYLDGDSPGAQKLGERFKVRGYPTMVLLRPDGGELTRLPGEVDARKYLQVLDLGLRSTRPLHEVLALAQSAPATLSPADWRLLAYYAWDTDEQTLVPKAQLARTLDALAAACPPAEAGPHARFALKAMAAKAEAAPDAKTRAAAALEQARAVLASEALLRDNLDIVSHQARELVAWLTAPNSDERQALIAQWGATLDRLTADRKLSQGDRAAALIGRVQLARLDAGAGEKGPVQLNEVVQAHVKREAARFDAEVGDADERQSVIPSAAYALAQAGLLDAADELLLRELDRSHSPYYAMLSLASNAKQRGDKAAALDWHRRAYEAAKGMATRVQWGSGYVQALVELAPRDAPRIRQAALAVLGELDGQRDAFYERTARALDRMSAKLVAWPREADERAVLQQLRARRDALCVALPDGDPQRRSCEALFDQPAARRKGAAA